MPMWTVHGSFLARRGYWQPFTKEHDADSGESAREWTLSEIGGCHGVQRHQIRIDSVTQASKA